MSTTQAVGRPNDILRARAQAQMVEQQRLATAARLTRARARNIRLALIATTALGTIFGLVLYFGMSMPGAAPTPWELEPSTRKFVATKSGQIRTPISGNKCRELNFDNQTGLFSNDTVVACDEDLRDSPSGKPTAAKNFNSGNKFRDAFR
ncbi:MAG: hypothetical protein JWN71_2226 [Xanthobacteraceae bacterium]|jgi:hypothetical protein|nr:hypothetical protein [Xanthobacteraceae bacterium]